MSEVFGDQGGLGPAGNGARQSAWREPQPLVRPLGPRGNWRGRVLVGRARGLGSIMSARTKTHLITLSWVLMWSAMSAHPAWADQIVALVDEHGHKVYINTGDTPKRPTDWMTHSFRELRRQANPLGVSPAEIDRLVEQTASRFQVDPQLVHAVIQAESDYDPNAVSRKGAIGLMQLVPATARRFGVANPFDPGENIKGGVNYLRYLLDLFGGDLSRSLAAYNAGENSVLRTGGIPAFQETQQYVRRVTNFYNFGAGSPLPRVSLKQPAKSEIIRYVDAQGGIHYTNVE